MSVTITKSYTAEPDPVQLVRYFHLDGADKERIALRRGDMIHFLGALHCNYKSTNDLLETRLSSLGHDHINFLRRYLFALAEQVAGGQLRSLTQPEVSEVPLV